MANSDKGIKDIVQQVTDAAKPYVDKAKPYVDKARETVEPQLKKAKESVEPQLKKAKEAVEPQIKKARKKAEPVVKEAVGKAAKAVTKTEVFLQFNEYELRTDDIVEKVREDYFAQGKTARDLKQLRIYIKPEDHAAYYVANHGETGKVFL